LIGSKDDIKNKCSIVLLSFFLSNMSYPYSLPTTGALSFTDYLENVTSYSTEISDATAQRGRLRAVLKELKKETQSTRDYQVIINVRCPPIQAFQN
jgi:hypothetical protein